MAVAGVLTLALLYPPTLGFAFFQDDDRSSENSLQAGSFDGNLAETGPATGNSTTDESNANQVRDTWEDYSHTNGTTDPVNNTIGVANPNTSFAVREVDITVSYVENDSALLNNDNAIETAKSMNISVLRFNGTSYKGNISDSNGNGAKDIDDLAQSTVTLGGIGATESVSLELSIAGDSRNNNNLGGGDGIDFTVHITSAVAPSWKDKDTSINNTIQYKS